MKKEDRLFIGTYNDKDASDIYSASFLNEEASIKITSETSGIEHPSYITLGNNNNMLYATSEVDKDGIIAAYKVNDDESLTLVNSLKVSGSYCCHVAVSEDNKYLLASNYMDGKADVFTLKQDGSLDELIYTDLHVGKGPNTERQECGHAHFANFIPNSNNIFLSVDLGCDKLFEYQIDGKNVSLLRTIDIPAGSGPRHFIFNKKDSSILYVVCELKMCVYVIKYLKDSYKILDCIDAIEKRENMSAGCSAIRIDDNNEYLYSACRVYDDGKDCIASYRIENDGMLSNVKYHYIVGKNSRDFVVHGDYIIDATQSSDVVEVYKIIKNDNIDLQKVNEIKINQPACILFK